MRIVNIVGARPNFVKIAPLIRAMSAEPALTPILVHTGQHYDGPMSEQFFTDLDIRPPDFNLGVGSGSHAAQTAEVMRSLEPVLDSTRPDLVLVVGDVNSTLAAALTAVKLHIPVAHVEAGLRSFDRSMPEEINRLLTDAIADLLFVTEESGRANLLREGIAAEKVHFVGKTGRTDRFQQGWPLVHGRLIRRLGKSSAIHQPSVLSNPIARGCNRAGAGA